MYSFKIFKDLKLLMSLGFYERANFGDSLRAAEDREGWKGIVVTTSVVL